MEYPDDFKRRPTDEAVTPFHKPEIIPPVTKMIFICQETMNFSEKIKVKKVFLPQKTFLKLAPKQFTC